MRTLSEINRDLQKCKNKQEKIKLEKEKEIVWNTLYEGHRNFRV